MHLLEGKRERVSRRGAEDAEFVRIIEETCRLRGISFTEGNEGSEGETINYIRSSWRMYLEVVLSAET